jgi:AraC-like DNA-binding protein
MTSLALLLIGFSLFSALLLALTHFRREHYQDQPWARIMGLALLLALSCLQLAHFGWLYLDLAWVETTFYRMTLFAVAPAFYLFSHPLLHPQSASSGNWKQLWHGLPVLLAPMLPGTVALPMAFIIGAGYLLWLARSLYALRQDRAGFRSEMLLLGMVFAVAIAVSVLGLVQSALPGKLFYSLYAISIGAAFLLVQLTLGMRPELSAEVSEVARESYASSTLTHVDCEAMLYRLHNLMQDERAYEDEALSLPKLAETLGLSPHQLSELMNTRLGKGFSRYLREQRIAAARKMLLDEPSASVLSVGLSVGFTSQSNFYEAFREIEGMTPGQFRRLNIPEKSPK